MQKLSQIPVLEEEVKNLEQEVADLNFFKEKYVEHEEELSRLRKQNY